jgi:hypothetical protein
MLCTQDSTGRRNRGYIHCISLEKQDCRAEGMPFTDTFVNNIQGLRTMLILT